MRSAERMQSRLPTVRAPLDAGRWVPPGGYDHGNAWAQANRAALESYDRRLQAHGTVAEQLQVWMGDEGDGV